MKKHMKTLFGIILICGCPMLANLLFDFMNIGKDTGIGYIFGCFLIATVGMMYGFYLLSDLMDDM